MKSQRTKRPLITFLLLSFLMLALISGCEWYFAQYFITITIKEGEGSTNPAPGKHGPYKFDQAVSVSATPAAGWMLLKIVENHSGDENTHTTTPVTVVLDASSTDTQVEVYFKRITPSYTVTSNTYYENTQNPSGGTVAISPAGGTYEQGTELTITCTPASGMEFVSMDLYGETSERTWVFIKKVSTTNTTTITANFNIRVDAFFKNL